jgi:flotillin
MKTETKVYENEREQSVVVSDANLSIQKHNVSAVVKIAGIEANKMADIEEAKLQKEVEIRNSQTQIEKLRAEQFSKTVVDAQIKKTMAEANAYNLERTANAIFNVSKCESEALAYKKSKEAESIKIMNEMNSKRITQLVDSFQESNLAFKYLAMESGIFEHLASQNVLALRGLEP